jgi:hypothetical protein
MAAIVSGECHLGYGDHFARTGADPVVVQISGYGPTDTHYFDAAKRSETARKEMTTFSALADLMYPSNY